MRFINSTDAAKNLGTIAQIVQTEPVCVQAHGRPQKPGPRAHAFASPPGAAEATEGTSRSRVISEGAPNRSGGPQYPVPRLV